MRLGARRAIFVSCLLFVLFSSIPQTVIAVTEFEVESTDIQIYRDGLVRVTQTLIVNETLPVVTLSLLDSLVDNFIVLDENQTVLDYEIAAQDDLSIFTLGTKSVSIQYDTSSLTKKDFEVWTFLVDSPYNLTVLLPAQSTIVYLNQMPTSIDTEGNQITLSLFSSQWEISYVFPLTPPADFQISNLEITPNEAKPGEEVTVSVKLTNVGGETGSYTIPFSINQIEEETKTVTLEPDQSTTVVFKVTKQTLGTYNIDVDGLVSKFTISETPSNGNQSDSGSVDYLVFVLIGVAVVVVVFLFLLRRRRPNPEKIFKTNPRLNQEEKDVIQFLVENEGKAFEAEIREKFPDIPRTSLWRLVKRLEKLDIVEIKKIGLENQVELKK
ncbi:MAG: hypothetical protein NWF06_01300 [Candidatus Bathyarchaeota archaeon]|nr:hypothetical protein [Candidatus Bathyarchaeum sp.]